MTSAHQPCFLRYMRCDDLCSSTVFPPVYEVWMNSVLHQGFYLKPTVFPPVYEVWMTSDHQGFYLKPTNFSPGKTYFSSEIYNFRLTFSYYVGFSSWLTMFRVPLEIYLLIFEMFLGMFFLILLLVV